MPGHRRISTDLFLANLDRSIPRSKIEALLELDLDDWRGTIRSVHGYARIWGWSRTKVRRLMGEFEAHRADLTNGESVGNTSKNRRTFAGPPGGPLPDPYLEQDPKEPERRGIAPPRVPAARGVGSAESRKRQARREVEEALAQAPIESEDDRLERERRLWILAEMFLACGRVADEAALRAYVRTTAPVIGEYFELACDRARAEDVAGGWPPPAGRIMVAAEAIAREARKRSKGRG